MQNSYSLLDRADEREVLPLFYAGGRAGASDEWVAKMRHAWRTLGPLVTAWLVRPALGPRALEGSEAAPSRP